MANNEEVSIWGVLLTLGGAWLGYKVYENREEILKGLHNYLNEQQRQKPIAQTEDAETLPQREVDTRRPLLLARVNHQEKG